MSAKLNGLDTTRSSSDYAAVTEHCIIRGIAINTDPFLQKNYLPSAAETIIHAIIPANAARNVRKSFIRNAFVLLWVFL